MKKVLFLVLTALFVFPFNMEAKKPKLKLTADIELESKHEGDASKIKFQIDDYMFFNPCYVEGFRVWNGTGQRVYIQWEDARLAYGKVCFDGDTPLTYQNPKADESVFNNSFSVSRKLFSASYINSFDNSLRTLYDSRSLKKSRGSTTVRLDLPIKFSDNHLELYKIKIIYKYIPEEDK